jgi:hypothetical protein
MIVVGRLHDPSTYPWFDGWHIAGKIDVDEILFGTSVPKQIDYRLVCRWASCRTWPPPPIAAFCGHKGIWFLRSVNGRTWSPPEYSGIDPGYRRIDERSDFENYIRRSKQ